MRECRKMEYGVEVKGALKRGVFRVNERERQGRRV